MKKLLCICFLLLFLSANGQKKYSAFEIINDSIVVPPNGILLHSNVFMDDSEVMNSQYLEYLHFLAQDSSENAVIKAYPDTNIFGSHHLNNLLDYQKKYYKKKKEKHKPVSTLLHDETILKPAHKGHWYNYFSFNGTKHFPVVGITYQQAISYCKWRSDFVSAYFNNVLKKKKKYKSISGQNFRFEFFLPTEAEWESGNGNDSLFNFPAPSEKDSEDSTLISHIEHSSSKLKHKNKDQPEFIFSRKPNKHGFYHLIGNVSEMTAIMGVSKGGSYLHNEEQCHPNNKVLYEKAEKWLGFRCVCRVKTTHL